MHARMGARRKPGPTLIDDSHAALVREVAKMRGEVAALSARIDLALKDADATHRELQYAVAELQRSAHEQSPKQTAPRWRSCAAEPPPLGCWLLTYSPRFGIDLLIRGEHGWARDTHSDGGDEPIWESRRPTHWMSQDDLPAWPGLDP